MASKKLLAATAAGVATACAVRAVYKIAGPRSTSPPQTPPGATPIAVLEKVTLGGLNQQLLIRGADITNPLLLVLHGGPGGPEGGLFGVYNRNLEEDFVVVHWDQRGAGRSFDKNLTADDLTIDQFLDDTHELITLLKRRYDQERVILLGHSWGSVLGTRYAKLHPENLHAYIGMGQVVAMEEAEDLSYQFTLDKAEEFGDEKATAKLKAIGPPPYDFASLRVQRKYVMKFGGAFHGSFSIPRAAIEIARLPEFNLWDVVLFARGAILSAKLMWDDLMKFNLFEESAEYECPIYFLLGRFDNQVPATLSARYFEIISAPSKELVWFEESAHSPCWEEPERFHEIVTDLAARHI